MSQVAIRTPHDEWRCLQQQGANVEVENLLFQNDRPPSGEETRLPKSPITQRDICSQHANSPNAILLPTKEKINGWIVEYLQMEDPDFNESDIDRLVYAIVSPILSDYTRRAGRKTVCLRPEKELPIHTEQRRNLLCWI